MDSENTAEEGMNAAEKESEIESAVIEVVVQLVLDTVENLETPQIVEPPLNLQNAVAVAATAAENRQPSASAAVSPPTASNIAASESQQRPTSTSPSTASTMNFQSFDVDLDQFFQKYLDTDPSQMDDRDIRAFTHQIPLGYVVPENRYQT